MDEMKVKLAQAVADQLAAAPQSAAKDELVEELSDNLYRRFLDMTGAGLDEDAAFKRALDDLGDVDELLGYLGVTPSAGKPDAAVNSGDGQAQIKTEDGQTRITTQNGQTIIINAPDDSTQSQGASSDGQPQGGQGGVHYDYDPGMGQSDLDAILANVSDICRVAMDQVKDAAKQARDAIQRRTTVQRDNGHVKVHFNTTPDGPVPPVPPEPPVPPVPPEPPRGWEFEAELDSDQGRFFAGGGPKERKDVVYGFGYDKTKGGFFAQWGEYQGDSGADHTGPHFSGEDSGMHANDDGSYSVTALKDLRGIEVFTVAGDVTIHVSEAPDAGVIIDGDVDDLDVTCSADGVLTIREGRTASSSFFSRRGIGSADVELYVPRRHWETIAVNTTSGDVEVDRDGLDIDYLTVTTASGDLSCRLRACSVLSFKSASGDLELQGACADLMAETMSGDISLRGQLGTARLKTASGDIELEGLVQQFLAGSMSGDLRLESSQMPEAMELSSKSGDCEARLPDAGPFTLRAKTVSGDLDFSFPMNYINGVFTYGDGSGPRYTMTSVSGSVTLERY